MNTPAQIRFADAFSDTFNNITNIVPKIIVAILILIVGRIIAGIVSKLVKTVLAKINFDAWIDRSGLGGPIERAGFADSGGLVAKVLYWLILLIFIQWAVGIFGDTPIQDVLNSIIAFIPKLIIAIAIIIITGIIATKVREIVGGALSTESYGGFVAMAAAAAIWFIGVSAALDTIDFAADILSTVVTTVFASLGLILVVKFGIGGIDSARDRFWPKVYDMFEGGKNDSNVG